MSQGSSCAGTAGRSWQDPCGRRDGRAQCTVEIGDVCPDPRPLGLPPSHSTECMMSSSVAPWISRTSLSTILLRRTPDQSRLGACPVERQARSPSGGAIRRQGAPPRWNRPHRDKCVRRLFPGGPLQALSQPAQARAEGVREDRALHCPGDEGLAAASRRGGRQTRPAPRRAPPPPKRVVRPARIIPAGFKAALSWMFETRWDIRRVPPSPSSYPWEPRATDPERLRSDEHGRALDRSLSEHTLANVAALER